MFPTWAIVLLSLVFAALVVFAGGAAIARRRERHRGGPSFDERLGEVDRALAAAQAADRGWQRDLLDAAARDAFVAAVPGAEIRALELVQVVDRPGTDEDHAVYRVESSDRAVRLTLGRRAGAWVGQGVEPVADTERSA